MRRTKEIGTVPLVAYLLMTLAIIVGVAHAQYTTLSCGTTVVNGAGNSYKYVSCNSAGTTITVSAAAAVSFYQCTFAGVTHPNTMTGYSLIVEGGKFTSSGKAFHFAKLLSASTISIHSSATITTTAWADTFQFNNGGSGNAISNVGVTITSATIKSSSGSDVFKVSGNAASSNFFLSNTVVSTGYECFQVAGSTTSVSITLKNGEFRCHYYGFYFDGAVSNSKLLLQTMIGYSNIVEAIRGQSGDWTNTQITIDGGEWSCPSHSEKATVRINNLMSSSTIAVVNGAYIHGQYAISVGKVQGLTLSVAGNSILEAATSYHPVSLGWSSGTSQSVDVTVSGSTLTGGYSTISLYGGWTSASITSSASSTFIGDVTTMAVQSVSGDLRVIMSDTTISTVTMTTGECFYIPTVVSTAFISMVSTTLTCRKGFYMSRPITGTLTVSMIDSSVQVSTTAFHADASTISNLDVYISNTGVTVTGGSLIWFSTGNIYANNVISVISSTISVSDSVATLSSSMSTLGLYFSGSALSRTTITAGSSVFNDGSGSSATLTSLSLALSYTDVFSSVAIYGVSDGYLTLSSPIISIASTVTISGYAMTFFGPIVGGTLTFEQASMASGSSDYFSFNGFVTSTAVTFRSIAFTGPYGLASWTGGCSGCTILITGVSASITGTSSANLISFASGTFSGMQLTITSSSLSYTVSSSSGVVAPVYGSGTVISGSTLWIHGNAISSTTNAVAHTVAVLYASSSTIAAASAIVLAKGSFNVAVSSYLPVYTVSTTVTGSSITLQCMSFESTAMPLVHLGVLSASSVRLESIAVWQSSVAGTSAVRITSASSSTVAITIVHSRLHVPVIIDAASSASVSSIAVACSWSSHSYAMSSGSFSSGLQGSVSAGSCEKPTYSSCWSTISRSQSTTEIITQTQTESEEGSSSATSTHSASRQLSVTVTETISTSISDASTQSVGTHSKTHSPTINASGTFPSQSVTTSLTDEITLPTRSRSAHTNSPTASKSPSLRLTSSETVSKNGSFSTTNTATINNSASHTRSLTPTASLSPIIPISFGVVFDWSALGSLNGSYFAAEAVPVFLLQPSSAGASSSIEVKATLHPRLSDNRNVTWKHYLRHPQLTPTLVSVAGASTLRDDTACTQPGDFLPCSLTIDTVHALDDTRPTSTLSVQYASVYNLANYSFAWTTNRSAVAFQLQNASDGSEVTSIAGVVGLPLHAEDIDLVLLDAVSIPARHRGADMTIEVIGSTDSSHIEATLSSNTYVDLLSSIVPTQGTTNLSVFLTAITTRAQVLGGPRNISIQAVYCAANAVPSIVATWENSTAALFSIPLTWGSDRQLYCVLDGVVSSAPTRVNPCALQCATSGGRYTKVGICRGSPSSCAELFGTLAVPGSNPLIPTLVRLEPALSLVENTQLGSCAVISFVEAVTLTPIDDIAAYSMSVTSLVVSGFVQASAAPLLLDVTLEAFINVSATSFARGRTVSGWRVCASNLTYLNGSRAFGVQELHTLNLSATVSGTFGNRSQFFVALVNASWNASAPTNSLCFAPHFVAQASKSSVVTDAYTFASSAAVNENSPLFVSNVHAVHAIVNDTAICSVAFSHGNVFSGVLSDCVPPLPATNTTPVETSVEVLRPDGYVDVGAMQRVTLATPTVRSLHGCPTEVFPSTADCALNGTAPLFVFGFGFSARNFSIGWKFPSLNELIFCKDLLVISDVEAHCVLYPGSGLHGLTQVRASTAFDAQLLSDSNATLSYTLVGSQQCPLSHNGLQCSGHGTCDFSTGECTCYQDELTGFWAGFDCSACSQRYNTSVGCLKKCPMNDEGVICSGVGHCQQGQCWCGTAWSDRTCVQCPGQNGACSGHGTCNSISGSCTCTSDAFSGYFNGSSCDACITGFSGASCNIPCPIGTNSLVCSGVGACFNGVCFCLEAYCGIRCELDRATQDCQTCANPSQYGPTCAGTCPGSSDPTSPCNGHGVCDAGQLGTGTCQCVAGFGGTDCSVACPIDATTHQECSGHGSCSASTGRCLCDRHYATSSCVVMCPFGNGLVCGGHGVCSEGSNGNGKCACDYGYGGAACNVTCVGDIPCSGHGTCSADGECVCSQDMVNGFWGGPGCSDCTGGYAGRLCNARCPQNAFGEPCSGHGVCGADLSCTCESSIVLGFWSGLGCSDCAAGYYGAACTQECPGGACNPCGGNGVCAAGVAGSGQCQCIANSIFGQWAGSDCQACVSGFYGSQCLQSCPVHNGIVCPNGVCDDGPGGSGLCYCKLGYLQNAFGHCLVCAPGYYGTLCTACPATSNGVCNGRGVCDDGVTGSGKCRCSGTAGGAACDSNCPTTAEGTLCGFGSCSTAGYCVCTGNYSLNATTGLCTSCERGKFGPTCTLLCGDCVFGNCHRVTGACICDTGYWGTACDAQCPGGASSPCSGHGTCSPLTGNCTCVASIGLGFYSGSTCASCDPRYASTTCKIPCPNIAGEICSGRGVCYNGACSDCAPKPQEYGFVGIVCGAVCDLRDDQCFPSTCPLGYHGGLCDNLCPGASVANPNGTCSGHGLCDTSGTCHCYAGYFGQECSSACPAAMVNGALRVCSARGSCRNGGACQCLTGFFGTACEGECPGGATNPCNGRGTCVNGTCACVNGAVGLACEQLCPGGLSSPCSYNGVCEPTGACRCTSNDVEGHFVGAACDTCADRFTGRSCNVKCLASRGVIRGTSCVCLEGFAGIDCSASCARDLQQLVCGGHGTCIGEETCRCDADYYGPRCTSFCTYAQCRSNFGLYRPQCNVSTGACECRSSSIGQWVGPLCDQCSPSTWGDECNLPCSCNNHGVCNRITGKCSCFGSDSEGFWAGTLCGQCRSGYFGVDCRSINVQITPPVLPSVESRAAVSLPVNGWMLFDATTKLALQGSTADFAIRVIGFVESGGVEQLSILTAPIGTTGALFFNTSHLLVVLVGGGRVFVERNRSSILNARALPSSQHRVMEYLAVSVESPVYMIVHSELCSLTWNFALPDFVECNGLRLFDFTGSASLRSVDYVAPSPLGSAIVVVGTSTDGSASWVLVVYNTTTSTRTVHRASTLHSGEVLRCTPVNEISIICAVYSRVLDSLALKRVSLVAPSGSNVVSDSQTVVESKLDANATAMGIDVDFDSAFIAYNFELQPSQVLTFRLSTLLPIGTFDLSGFYIVTSLEVDSVNRMLIGTMEDSFSTAFLALNLFGIRSVVPNIVDLAGGALMTVFGEGYDVNAANDTWCIVSGVEIQATLVDTNTITCVAPPAQNALSACVTDTIDVRFGNRATSQQTIGVLRPVSAGLLKAVTAYGTIAYGSYDLATNVTLSGFGFVDSPYAKCRLVNRTRHILFVGSAHYINSTTAMCEQPAGLPPTDTWSALEYSHDGTYFGSSAALYLIVGPAVHVVAEQEATTVIAAASTKLFDFAIFTTDVYFNRRLVLEARDDSIRCSSNIPDLAIINSPEVLSFSPHSILSVPLAVGVSRFTSVWVQKPKTGSYSIHCFSFGDTTIATRFSFSVIPGPRASIELTTSEEWVVGVLQERTLLPKPTVWIADIAGNRIANLAHLPPSVKLTTPRAVEDRASGLTSYNTSVFTALPDEAGFYVFDGVVVRTAFDVPTTLSFTASGVPSVVIPLPQETCSFGVEYAVSSSFYCNTCPTEAYCDGTSNLVTRPGYWRGARKSLSFYECVPSEACPSASACQQGYSGRKCASCAEGYGRSIDGCDTCWSDSINWLMNILAFIVVCIVIHHSSLAHMDVSSLREFELRRRLNQLSRDEEKVNALVIKLAQSHLQMLTSIPFAELPLPLWLKSMLATSKSTSSADPNLGFITCSIAPTPTEQLYLALAILPLLMIVFAIICGIIAWRRSDHRIREEEEMQRRRDVATGKYNMENRIEAAYQSVQANRTRREARHHLQASEKARGLEKHCGAQRVMRGDNEKTGDQEADPYQQTLSVSVSATGAFAASASAAIDDGPVVPSASAAERKSTDDPNPKLVVFDGLGPNTSHVSRNDIVLEDEEMDFDDVRRKGYQSGTLLTDLTRQLRSIDVLVEELELDEEGRNALVEHRVQIFAGEDEADVATMKAGLNFATIVEHNTRKREFIARFINMFLVCIVCILFELYPTLLAYSSKLLKCESLDTDEGTLSVMKTNPQILCTSSEYRAIQAVAIVVLIVSMAGIPVIMTLFIVIVARTTCSKTRATYAAAQAEVLPEYEADERAQIETAVAVSLSRLAELHRDWLATARVDRSDSTTSFEEAASNYNQDLSAQLELCGGHSLAHRFDEQVRLRSKALSLQAARRIFFFVCGRYKLKLWYWESFSLLKKMALVLINVLIPELSLRLLASMWVMMMYVVVNMEFAPWDDRVLDFTENFSICALAVTFGLIELLFFESVQASEGLKTAIFVVIAIINILTIVLLFRTVFRTANTATGLLRPILVAVHRVYKRCIRRRLQKDRREELRKILCTPRLQRARQIESMRIKGLALWEEAEKLVIAGGKRLPTSEAWNGASSIPSGELPVQAIGGLQNFFDVAQSLTRPLFRSSVRKEVPLGGCIGLPDGQVGRDLDSPTFSWLTTEDLIIDFCSKMSLVFAIHRVMLMPPEHSATRKIRKKLQKIAQRVADALPCYTQHQDDIVFLESERTRSTYDQSAEVSNVDLQPREESEDLYDDATTFLTVWMQHMLLAEKDFLYAFKRLRRSLQVLRGQLTEDELEALRQYNDSAKSAKQFCEDPIPSPSKHREIVAHQKKAKRKFSTVLIDLEES